MGFDFRVGEAIIDHQQEDYLCSIDVKKVNVKEAPIFNKYWGQTNKIHVSYGGWKEICRFIRLEDLFYDTDADYCLLQSHPGCVPITPFHLTVLNNRYSEYLVRCPSAIPTFGNINKTNMLEGDKSNPIENNMLCWLVWLIFWFKWALNNCERPVFCNS